MKKAKPACSVREFKELMETDPFEVRFIRTIEDWKEYSENVNSKDHPLQPLTSEEVEEFTNDLVFNKGGIAGVNVEVVQKKLSYLQYEELMASFGMSIVFAADHDGYECKSRGTCVKRSSTICTSNC